MAFLVVRPVQEDGWHLYGGKAPDRPGARNGPLRERDRVLAERPALERRLLAALAAAPSRIPVIVGGCGTGRTTLLTRLRERLGPNTEYIDVERIATTPEGFFSSATRTTRYHVPEFREGAESGSAKMAFERICQFLTHARTDTGDAVTFLLDEALEVRTFESFPGLRGALRDFWHALCDTSNRFVLSTRFMTRTLRLFRDAPGRFEFVHLPPLTPTEVTAALAGLDLGTDDQRAELARVMHALTDGRPRYLRLLAESTAAMGVGDPVSALAAQLAPDAPLSMACRFSYELRLHRARGYGALKAILQVLATEEPLTLTEVSQRIGRTPGSTKDYLSWLEDVDLLKVQHKRYRFTDPLLRLWVQLHGQARPPSDEDLSRGAQEYAVGRFPYIEPIVPVTKPLPQAPSWNLIEID